MPPKKAKAQKMNLVDFFADTTTGSGSWADEMDLPTAPAARDPNAGPRRGEPGYLDSMPDRGTRADRGPPREELPLPTVPPFTAFIGNLTFETDESELKAFFASEDPISTRLVKDATGKAKGFGYVEFASQDTLKAALEKNMSSLGGRSIRVSVADAPSGNRREHAPSAAEEASQWRRSGPLPVRESPAAPRRGPSFSGPAIGGAGGSDDRDWGAARGARFTPAPPTPSYGGIRRETSGPGRERSFEPSVADDANQWRSSRPLAEPIRRDGPMRQDSELSSPGLADTEATWSRGTKLRTPISDAPPRSGSGTQSPDERAWRSPRLASAAATPDLSGEQGFDAESPRLAAPTERKKLTLAPRSVPATPSTTTPDASAPASSTNTPNGPATTRSSIFGGAKPVDSATREKEAEQKLASREADRKVAAAKAKEEEEKKIKELADERQRSIREAQETARAEFGGPAPSSNTNGPTRGGAATRGNGIATRGGRGGAGFARKSSTEGTSNQGPKSPTLPRNKSNQTPVIGEDGFEVARGGGNKPTSTTVPEKKKEPAKTRQGFSFAAAMKATGLVDDNEEDNEGTNGDAKAQGDVEGLAKEVQKVEV